MLRRHIIAKTLKAVVPSDLATEDNQPKCRQFWGIFPQILRLLLLLLMAWQAWHRK